MVKGLHHVQIVIPIGCEQEAREFYCGVLGLKEIPKPKSLEGRGGFWLAVGTQELHVGVEPSGASKGKAHVAFIVEDVDTARNTLLRAGVQVVESVPIPGMERFEFCDPFGNRTELLHPGSGTSHGPESQL